MKYPITDSNCSGAIYILTNPIFNAVKIGYATNIEARRADLSKSTAIPLDFELYAYYEVSKFAADKALHSIISTINPELRINPAKEFFNITPEDAYKIFERISVITDTENRLHLIKEEADLDNSSSDDGKKGKVRSPFNFKYAGIPIGTELIFNLKHLKGISQDIKPPVCTVYDNRKIKYKNEITSLSKATSDISNELTGSSEDYYCGTDWWLYNGETLWDLRNRMEKEGTYGADLSDSANDDI